MKTTLKKHVTKKTRKPFVSREKEQEIFKGIKNPRLRIGLKEHKERNIPKGERNVSVETAMCKASALGPTRVVLPINFDSLVIFLTYIAKVMSYEIQSRGSLPRFPGNNTEAQWSPSELLAYLLAIYGTRFAKVGALPASSDFICMGSYLVPTFVGKHLQQISPSTHMGREIALEVGVPLQNFLNQECGTGSLAPIEGTAALGAPCYYDVLNDTEPWFSYEGPTGASQITAATMSASQFSKLSATISRCFTHSVKVSEIPDRASSNELKVTPVSKTVNGQIVYSCIDSDTMCDLTLPLSGFNEPYLVNSTNPLQSAAPVRVDGSISMCIEAKISFLFWLANKNKFNTRDGFLTYLRRFGVKDKNLGNLQLNLRQVNWTSLFNMCVAYSLSLTDLSAEGFWYFVNYVFGIALANIPGCFRAFCPIRQDFDLSRQYKTLAPFPNYAQALKNVKMPPFIANAIHALATPIRSGNQISFFFQQVGDSGTTYPWWERVASNATGGLSLAGAYGEVPLTLETLGLSWSGGLYRPYPGFTAANPGTAYGSPVYRNTVTLRGTAALTGYLQGKLLQNGGSQNLYNQWNNKGVKFMKRSARFYIPSIQGQADVNYPAGTTAFTAITIVPQIISSFEPVGYASTLLALANMVTYYLPSVADLPLIPVFSSVPNVGCEDSTTAVITAANPGQGSQQAIKIAAATNPEEAQAHISAEAGTGAIADQSTPIPDHLKHKVDKELHNLVHTGVDEAKTLGKEAVQKGGKAIVDNAGKLFAVLA